MTSRIHVGIAGLVGALLALLLWLLLPTPSVQLAPAITRAPDQPDATFRASQRPYEAGELEPLIEALVVDRERACVGESVAVEAILTEAGRAARVFVNGRPGSRQVVQPSEEGALEIVAVARGWSGEADYATVGLPVDDCPGRPRLHVVGATSASESDTVVFEVVATEGLGPRPRFRWTFEDGEVHSGPEQMITHSVAMRSQTGPTTSVVVEVEATDGSGRSAEALAAATVVNAQWFVAQAGGAEMVVRHDRFPEARAGMLTVDLEVRNIDLERDLAFEDVSVSAVPCRGVRSLAARPGVGALDLVGVDADSQASGTLRLNPDRFGEDVCTWSVELVARYADGQPVTGRVILETGIAEGQGQPMAREHSMAAFRASLASGRSRVGQDEIRHASRR